MTVPDTDDSTRAGAEVPDIYRDLLVELETALLKTQEAVLAGNVVILEQATSDQVRLQQRIAYLSQQMSTEPHAASNIEAGSGSLRDAQERVLRLGRVQAVLLTRAGKTLSIFANLLSGSQSTYGPPSCKTAGVSARGCKAEGADPCQG